MVYPYLAEVLEWCCDQDGIDEIVVISNGTIVPKDNVIQAMINKKVVLRISDYGELSREKDRIKNMAKEHGIRIEFNCHPFWYDLYSYEFNDKDDKQLEKQYQECQIKKCWCITNGILYPCTPAYNKMEMVGEEKSIKNGFIPILEMEVEEIQREITRIMNSRYIGTCRYCLGTQKNNVCMVAEQRK